VRRCQPRSSMDHSDKGRELRRVEIIAHAEKELVQVHAQLDDPVMVADSYLLDRRNQLEKILKRMQELAQERPAERVNAPVVPYVPR